MDLSADRPDHKWAGDISYLLTSEGWMGFAIILDLYSRRVVGWAVSNRIMRDLAIRALTMAIAFRSPPKGRLHHTNRGSKYCPLQSLNEQQMQLLRKCRSKPHIPVLDKAGRADGTCSRADFEWDAKNNNTSVTKVRR